MKIVFIDPKGVWEGLNNGVAYIDSNIRNEHDVKVIDFVNRNGNEDKRLDAVKDAHYVGISIKSFTLDESIRLANKIRQINPNARIIAGGPHIMVDGLNFMNDNAVFDIAIKGESEIAFREILEKPISSVDGVIYREGGEVKENCARKWITNLDEMEFPTYDDFDSVVQTHKIDKWPLVTSRGCPYTCSYCFDGNMIVRTDNGDIKIKDVKNGMKVITDKGNLKSVARTFVHFYSGKMIEIEIEGKKPIISTPNHKIKIFRNGFEMIRADQLKVRDLTIEVVPCISCVTTHSSNQISLLKNETKKNLLPIKSIKELDFIGHVYNMEVEDDHTYTINGIAVSNCNVPVVIGRKFRTRSGENIIKELRYAREKYGCNEFKILDDNFTLLMDRAKDICRLFIEEKIDMKWTCPNGIRADRLDDELCELMARAGCYSVSIGVESGDPEVFRKINKGERLEDVERGIAIAKRAGLKVHGFFILGLVGSTYEADKRSMEFVKKVGLDSASWGILVPYPGTEVWNQVRSDSSVRMLRDWKEGFHIGARPKPVFDTLEYPAEQRIKAFYLANMKFTKARDYPRAAKMVIKSLLAGK